MMSKSSEAEFVLDRLCESMQRYIKMASVPVQDSNADLKQPPQAQRRMNNGFDEKDQSDIPGTSASGSEDDIGPLDNRTDTIGPCNR